MVREWIRAAGLLKEASISAPSLGYLLKWACTSLLAATNTW
jgi:hypothetical protein